MDNKIIDSDLNVESATELEVVDQSERGASMVEYALLVALIAVIALVAVRTVGQEVSSKFSTIQSELARTSTGGSAGGTLG